MADKQSTDAGLRELALFAGAGGGILGGHLLGWRTVCAVEYNTYAASVLLARQNDGMLPPFPIWDDVRTFDGRPWRGIVDVISGGFPCQDISAAGKGAGIDGERSGLWREMARIIGEVRPRCVFVENSPLLVGRGAAVVIGDLAAMGYDAHWCCLAASDVGAPHKRDRFWLVANSDSRDVECRQSEEPGIHGTERSQRPDDNPSRSGEEPAHVADTEVRSMRPFSENNWPSSREVHAPDNSGCTSGGDDRSGRESEPASVWPPEPDVGRVANGVAARVDRLSALGNGQVPRVAATAFDLLR
jgi:DNA (cytosine-5)-methyltransferase 1